MDCWHANYKAFLMVAWFGAIISGIVSIVFAAVQMHTFKQYLEYFIDKSYHSLLSAYFFTVGGSMVVLGILIWTLKWGYRRYQIFILTIALSTLLMGSFACIASYVNFHKSEIMFDYCQQYPQFNNYFVKAQNQFCHQCRCYMNQSSKHYNQTKYPNIQSNDSSKPHTVTNCSTWIGDYRDSIYRALQNKQNCAGWCVRPEIYYFTSNQECEGQQCRPKQNPSACCFDAIHRKVQTMYWFWPILISGLTISTLAFVMILFFVYYIKVGQVNLVNQVNQN